MSIENDQAKNDAIPEINHHLLTGLFTPGEKTALAPVPEQFSERELLQRNDQIIAEVHAHAARIAAAAVTTLKGIPADYHKAFFDGISCYNGNDDLIYNSVRQQWNGGDAKTA